MKEFRLCKEDFDLIVSSVTMKAILEKYGFQTIQKGAVLWAQCPFHNDKHPSMRVNENWFYCHSCGAAGDVITFVAKLHEQSNTAAAKEIAEDFNINLVQPLTYREKRERAKREQERRRYDLFIREHTIWYRLYRNLLCEALHEQNSHFDEALQNLTLVDYWLDCLEKCPQKVYQDKEVVKRLGTIKRRISDWYFRTEADGTIS